MTFSWQMAEELAAAHMRQLGFGDARRTGAGADRGIDVVAKDAVAQVKYLSSAVGAPDIQRFRGASHGVDAALFYSVSGYSAAAIVAANATGIALFSYTVANDVVALNQSAKDCGDTDNVCKLELIFAVQSKLAIIKAVPYAYKSLLNGVKDQTIPMWKGMEDDIARSSSAIAASRAFIGDEVSDEIMGGDDYARILDLVTARAKPWEELRRDMRFDGPEFEAWITEKTVEMNMENGLSPDGLSYV